MTACRALSAGSPKLCPTADWSSRYLELRSSAEWSDLYATGMSWSLRILPAERLAAYASFL